MATYRTLRGVPVKQLQTDELIAAAKRMADAMEAIARAFVLLTQPPTMVLPPEEEPPDMPTGGVMYVAPEIKPFDFSSPETQAIFRREVKKRMDDLGMSREQAEMLVAAIMTGTAE